MKYGSGLLSHVAFNGRSSIIREVRVAVAGTDQAEWTRIAFPKRPKSSKARNIAFDMLSSHVRSLNLAERSSPAAILRGLVSGPYTVEKQ